jgi:membrane protease YdiL (CAAX protease family)
VYYRTGNLFIAIGLHAFMNTPTLVVGPQGLGETYAVYLAIVVAVGWPWFHRVATRTGLTGTSEDESSVSE